MTVKGFFKSLWEDFKFLLFTPNWGNKRRREQQEYEERLDEGVTSVTEYGTYTPEYIYKQWNGEASLWQIKRAMKEVASEG